MAESAAQLQARAKAERERRRGDSRRAWSLESFCGGHVQQLAFCQAVRAVAANWFHLLCDRQSGKTQGDMGVLNDNALAHPRTTNFFLGLKGTGLEISVWPKWKHLLDSYDIDRKDDETLRISYYPNGAMVVFAGTDDLENIKKYLGNRLDNSVFVIDEGQDQKTAILEYLIERLLPPMCTPTTRVILSGVLPDVPAGYFLDNAAHDQASETGGKGKKWKHFSWGRLDNVHTPEAAEMLARLEAQLGIDDPQLMRDWKGVKRVWRKDATGYHYSRPLNGYVPTVPDWLEDARAAIEAQFAALKRPIPIETFMAAVPRADIDCVSMAIDPGGGDRTSLSATGWAWGSSKVQHLFEWCTPRNSLASLAQMKAVGGIVKAHYPLLWSWWDAPGKLEIDDWGKESGIYVVQAARKNDFPGQVRKVNDLLDAQSLDIMIGSGCEADMQRAKFDKDARAKHLFKWSSEWHPDPSESTRYTLAPFWDSSIPPMTAEQAQAALYLEGVRRAEQLALENRAVQHEYSGDDEFQNDEYSDVA
jgi:hypothetical protein